MLRGWSVYFSHATRLIAQRAADNHAYEPVRHLLPVDTRCKRAVGVGFRLAEIFGTYGVQRAPGTPAVRYAGVGPDAG
jgi:hypothetical protein